MSRLRTPQSIRTLIVFSILSLLCLSFADYKIEPEVVQAQETVAIESGWLDEFTYRQDLSNDNFMEHFYLDPQVFWDADSSSWLNFSVTDNRDHANPHFLVINSRLKVRIGISNEWDLEGVLFYAPDGSEPVCAEVWEIQVFYQESWQTLTREFSSYEVDYSSDHFNITGRFRMTSPLGTVGWMSLNFFLEPAGFLKHTFGFRRVIAGAALEFRAVMTLLGVPSDLVEGQDETVILKPEAVERIWNRLIFRNQKKAWLQQLEVRLDDLGHFEFNETTGVFDWVNDWIRAIKLSTFNYKGKELGRADVVIGNLLMSQGQEVFIDPTLSTFTINNNIHDGYAYCHDAVYANARDGSGTMGRNYAGNNDPYGNDWFGGNYYVWRVAVRWNTSTLDDTAVIDNASVRHYVSMDQSTIDFNVSITLWTGNHTFHLYTFLDCEDVYLDDQQTDSTGGLGWTEPRLINYSVINLTGFTNLMIRSNRDIDAVTPTGFERLFMEDYNAPSTNHAELKVWWHPQPTPQPNLYAADTHQANTEATFSCNWTADQQSPPTTNMSHWIFGSNVSGTFENDSAMEFYPTEEIVENLTVVGFSPYYVIWNEHPSALTAWSASGQGITLHTDSAKNITGVEFKLRKLGSPDCKIMVGIYNMTGTIPYSYPDSVWSPFENSSDTLEASDLTTSFLWYRFNFSGAFRMEPDDYYGFCMLAIDEVLLDVSNRIEGEENGDNEYADGNQPIYRSSVWLSAGASTDLYFKLWGKEAFGNSTWSNVTKTLPLEVGQYVAWQFSANNTQGFWNTIGLQTFITVGVNFTFYHNLDGFFSFSSISRLEAFITTANASVYGIANGTSMSLFGSPKNASYYWLNFTWDASSSTENYANVSVVLGMEGYNFWCYFNSTPTGDGGEAYVIARFHWNATLPDILQDIQFDASASDSSSTITIYEWDFGDGNNGTGITSVHDYVAYGNYSVVLNVTSAAGSNSTYQYLTIGSTPTWQIELNTLPNWEVVILLIVSIFFSIMFFGTKQLAWGYISFGGWLIEGIVWLFINPVSYFVSLLFFGIAIIILALTLIMQIEALRMVEGRRLGEETMTPV